MSTRTLLAVVCLASAALGAPPLTTIQDTLYKADGKRFAGTLTISWNTFQGPNNSTIIQQSTAIRVDDGYLKVQLVPTTSSIPAAYYTVSYNSDGRVQFQETWSVPSSDVALRVADVRVSVIPAGGISSPELGTVEQSDVIGLVSDLAARAVKGPGYAPGVALVNESGTLEAVAGSPADCVRVDGSSTPCGSPAPAFVDGYTPAGLVDGANRIFGLSGTPDPVESLAVYRNGLRQKAGLDYTLNGRDIEFAAVAAPQPGDTLLASFRVGGEDGAGQMFPSAQVLCSGIGAVTNLDTVSEIGSCTIPAGTLLPGDHLEIRFDLDHQGSGGGFTFDVQWGGTTVVTRTAGVSDTLTTGRVDISVLASGTQFSSQSWGSELPFAASLGTAAGDYAGGLRIAFQGRLAQPGDTLALRNYSVVRFP